MKLKSNFMLAVFAAATFFSCNEDEGFGGKSSIEGYVYECEQFDDNYSFRVDTFTAKGKTVYIRAADDDVVLDKIDTNEDGYYRFDYLRKGNYKVYAYSKGKREVDKTPEVQTLKVGAGTLTASPIFVHSGDIYNSAMIKGKAWVKYYKNGVLTRVEYPYQSGVKYDSIASVKIKVFLVNKKDRDNGVGMTIASATPNNEGVFIFKELRPNEVYEVYMLTEPTEGTYQSSYKNVNIATEPQEVAVGEPYKYYPLEEQGDTLSFTIRVNQ
jgi:hypothetical protein